MLPGFVRELILHDRGNSLYLSDSFANLPSPVNETQNLKQLFKPKDNEEDLNRNGRRKDKGKDSNVEIRIEGKDKDAKDKSPDPNKSHVDEESYDKKAMANIDVRDIERIVFHCPPSESNSVYVDLPGKRKEPVQEYVEEESYMNPPQVDSQSDFEEDDRKSMRAINYRGMEDQYQEIERNTIKINYNDICIDEPSSHASIAEEPIII